MKKLPIFLSLAAAALSLAACNKELDEVVKEPGQEVAAVKSQSPAELLSAGSWRLTDLTSRTVTAGSKEAATVSLLERLKPWMRDNTTEYQAGGAYTISEGALKVSPQAPQIAVSGAWQLNAAGDSLTVRQNETVRRYSIAELTATTLRLNYSEGSGPVTTYTSVFSR